MQYAGNLVGGNLALLNEIAKLKKENENLKKLIKTITATATYQAEAESYVNILFDLQIPDGYKALGVIEWNTNTSGVYAVHVRIGRIEGRNISTLKVNTTASMTILCIKDFSKED